MAMGSLRTMEMTHTRAITVTATRKWAITATASHTPSPGQSTEHPTVTMEGTKAVILRAMGYGGYSSYGRSYGKFGGNGGHGYNVYR